MSKKASSAQSGKSSTSKSGNTSVTESDTTEKSVSEMGGEGQPVSAATQYDTSIAQAASAYAHSSKSLQNYSVAGPISKDQQDKAATQIKKMASASNSMGGEENVTGRKVYVMRHGERMDRLFPEWLSVAITDEEKYTPYDMNQPLTMIERSGGVGWAGYEHDSPITEMGNLGGQMVGRGLKSCKADINILVSSPALRCVQTAHAILKTLENPDLKISIEPGLFEWLAWYDKMPQWFDPQTLAQTGKYKINETYKAIMSMADLVTKKNETTLQYYERVTAVTKKLIDQFKGSNATLIVGHGSTVEIVGRSLVGKPAAEFNRGEMEDMGLKYPYCAMVAVEETESAKWRVISSDLPQLNFLGFSNRFDPDYFNRP